MYFYVELYGSRSSTHGEMSKLQEFCYSRFGMNYQQDLTIIITTLKQSYKIYNTRNNTFPSGVAEVSFSRNSLSFSSVAYSASSRRICVRGQLWMSRQCNRAVRYEQGLGNGCFLLASSVEIKDNDLYFDNIICCGFINLHWALIFCGFRGWVDPQN